MNKDHAYVIISLEKCTESKRIMSPIDPNCLSESCERYDPPCASLLEINEWLKGKKSMMMVI